MADTPDISLLLLTVLVSAGASVISGIAGGGSGFIIAPFFILMGLHPALATATAKMNEVGVNISSVMAMRIIRRRAMATETGLVVAMPSSDRSDRQSFLATLFVITMVNVSLAAWFIPRLQAEGAQYIIGGLLLLMIPTLFLNKKMFKAGYRSKQWQKGGYILYSIVSFFQALFGMGIGMFVSMVLMYMFGIPLIHANDLKRRLMMAQSVVLLILLLAQDAVAIHLGVAALFGALVGAQLGTRIGVKKGHDFIKKIMAIVMFASAIALLVK